jgi:hypothetical protein
MKSWEIYAAASNGMSLPDNELQLDGFAAWRKAEQNYMVFKLSAG